MSQGSSTSVRLAPEWATRLPLAFVVLSLAALIAIPWLTMRQLAPIEHEMTQLAEPGRGLVTQIHLAMAQQGALLDDYIVDRDSTLLVRFREAEARERVAYAELTPLVNGLGAVPRERLTELQGLEDKWHDAVDVYVRSTPELSSLYHDREQEDLYDKTLIAAARLDEAITRAIHDRRGAIQHMEDLQQRVSALLAVLALAAAATTWWLSRRVRRYALEAEERRAELVDAMASRARFMRGVSHDLKNPINALDGHAQLLEDGLRGPLTPEQLDSVSRIRRCVRSMMGLIDDLLELARAESGQITITKEPILVRDVVRELVEEQRPAAEAAGLALVHDGNGVDTRIVTDPSRVVQVLGNLISNAIKYTPRGGRIDVSTELLASRTANHGAPSVAIHVADNGAGIPQEKYEEIFAEFTRLKPNEQPGQGLGLSIARRVARMLGGDVTVEGRTTGGAMFTLWLPVDSSR